MKSDIRKDQILQAAYQLSSNSAGWIDLTRLEVARKAECAEGLINRYFSTMEKLKDAVMELAAERKNIKILEQGAIYNNKVARKALAKLKS